MQNAFMRTTITLDDNAYEIASLYASAKSITLSKALSELVRKATSPAEDKTHSPHLKRMKNGLLVLTGSGRKLTSEMVYKALEEEN